MRMNPWFLFAAVFLVGCSSSGSTGAAGAISAKGDSKSDAPLHFGSAQGYRFVYKPPVVGSIVYDVKISGDAAGHPVNMTQTRTLTVTDAGSGNFKVDTVQEGSVGPKITTVEVVTADRKVLSTTVNGETVDAYAGGASPRDMLPDHAVNVGETWTGKRVIGGKPIEAEYKLDKVDTVGGVDLATVDIVKVNIDGGKIVDTGSFVMEVATGVLHRWKMHQTNKAGGTSLDISMEKR